MREVEGRVISKPPDEGWSEKGPEISRLRLNQPGSGMKVMDIKIVIGTKAPNSKAVLGPGHVTASIQNRAPLTKPALDREGSLRFVWEEELLVWPLE
ncbi:MAG: hypothetical protein CM1200mP24_10300 [Gammaproteobacteria bacterium]|nr:MAG: hypothetical protein CM1200mP24_10300 [Gammaproteobacteria bacterium]